MTFKTKALGLLAGSALMLSIASGATAEEVTVTLAENPTAKGCTIESINFPSLEATWDGSKYVYPANNQRAEMSFGFDSASPGDSGQCNAFVWGTNFTGQDDNSNTFDISRLALGSGYPVSSNPDNPTQFLINFTPNPANPWMVPLVLDLDDVTVPPDDYVSTLTFTVTTSD